MYVEPVVAFSRIVGTRKGLESLDLKGQYARAWIDALRWAEAALTTDPGGELAPVPASALEAR